MVLLRPIIRFRIGNQTVHLNLRSSDHIGNKIPTVIDATSATTPAIMLISVQEKGIRDRYISSTAIKDIPKYSIKHLIILQSNTLNLQLPNHYVAS